MKLKKKIFFINAVIALYSLFNGHRNKPALSKNLEFTRIAIYSTTALGDLLFNTPAIKAIRKRYPQAKILFVTSEKNSALVMDSPWFDQVEVWDNKVKNLHRLLQKLRAFKPEITFILHANIYYDILCAKLSGSTYIVRDNFAQEPTIFNRWLDAFSKPADNHIIQRKLDTLGLLGCETTDISMAFPVDIAMPERSQAPRRIGFQMGASKPDRCWPVKRFVELATLLLTADPQTEIVLTGAGQDLPLEHEFLQQLPASLYHNVHSLIGKTSLIELIQQIGTLTLLVTGDTGPLHLAITARTPTLSLYVGANPRHTGPYQDPHLHRTFRLEPQEGDDRARPLGKISAEAVFAQIQPLLFNEGMRDAATVTANHHRQR